MDKKYNYKIVLMFVLLAGACFVTYYCRVVLKTSIVFTHLFYIPIVLASIWWKRKGLVIPLFLAGLLISSHCIFAANVAIINDCLRIAIFLLVAIFVALISERIARIQMKLQKHREEVLHVSRLSTIGQMASGLAHELNQPLCAILSCSDLCLRAVKPDIKNTDRLTENLQTIATQAELAGEIIRRIRNFVQKRQTHRTTVNINNIIREVVDFMASDIWHNEIKLNLHLSEQIPMVLADDIQIEQVLMNLIRNSIEAMKNINTQERQLIIQTSVNLDNIVEVSVCDTGEGLSPEVADKMFESFFSTKPEGLGIGLSISYSIIEVHKGELSGQANSDYGSLSGQANSDYGSTFRFTLQAAQKTPA